MSRLLLRNWRVWQRLVALILVPTAVAAALCVQEFQDAAAQARQYHRTEALVRLSGAVADLGYELAAERGLSNGYASSGRRRADLLEPVKAQRAKTDAAAAEVRRLAEGSGVDPESTFGYRVQTVLGLVDTIGVQRDGVTGTTPPMTVFTGYTTLISELLSFLDVIEQSGGDPELGYGQRLLRALALAAENAGQQRGMLNGVLRRGSGIRGDELTVVLVARQQHLDRVADFKLSAGGDEIRLYDETVTGTEVARAYDILREVIEAVRQAFSRGSDASRLDRVFRENAGDWFAVMTVLVDRIHQVEERIIEDLVGYSERRAAEAESSRLRLGGLLSAVMLVVLAFTLAVARSLVVPLRALRGEALDIAARRLPGTVRRLREEGLPPGEPLESVAAAVVPPRAHNDDEIGQVARAFDEVHREAVRLAAEEARLRGDVNTMFVNLSRRSQTLVELQLKLIERLEDDEPDAERLGQLFRLDHLATRMRRNAESLLVLGGVEQVRRAQRPVALIDVVRAAVSEVEQYARVRPRLQEGLVIAGPVVGDLVHLLAELVENALTFSPDTAKVEVTGQLMSDRSAVLQVIDHGVGMTGEELHEANHRLCFPGEAGISVARRMGLFVVGRLAARHGIRVELRPVEFGGVGVMIVLPPEALVESTGLEPVASGPDGSAPASGPVGPSAPQPAPSAPSAPSAAEGTGALQVLTVAERSPIFAAVESEWFHRGAASSAGGPPADPGWERAAQVSQVPAVGGVTGKGLPKRVPGANKVHGGATPPTPAAGPVRSADDVASRLDSLQRGVRKGRHSSETREP
ncbi:nitrate- and nitrite sensing domain-containing protein [Actinocorallia sp. B10E7]|uniref:sensor histidine kinase n=1 Tax=Actinocorallia sp. B10E7 TaxID=3153558 RepID=UPI00325C6B54